MVWTFERFDHEVACQPTNPPQKYEDEAAAPRFAAVLLIFRARAPRPLLFWIDFYAVGGSF